MSGPDHPVRCPPARVHGAAHVVAAAGYSRAGLVRLWHETAFRHEVIALLASGGALIGIGAGPVQLAGLVALFLLLFAVEALNTAIEVIVDRISPGWSEAARDAKDLGSFAVLCLLTVIAGYVGAVAAGCLWLG